MSNFNRIENLLLLAIVFTIGFFGYMCFELETTDVLVQSEDISNMEMIEIKMFLFEDKTNKLEYFDTEFKTFTCFDFSHALYEKAKEKNINLGFAGIRNIYEFNGDTELHLINYVYINDKLYFIEPQNDELFTIEDYKGYFYDMNYITIVKEDEIFPRQIWSKNNISTNFRHEVDYDLSGD